jgi:hypothetical protein
MLQTRASQQPSESAGPTLWALVSLWTYHSIATKPLGEETIMKRLSTTFALSLLLMSFFAITAFAQITPSDDAYTLTSSPTVNFGAKNTLEVESAGATSFVRFDLSGIPSTVTGSMVAKATLKIYVSTVTTAGSFNVDLVTSSWKESTITANSAPTLGSAIASAVPVTTTDKNQYVLVDVTAAAVDWLNGTTNDGLAIVPDGAVSFALNSKETTTTSHPAELDVVLTGPAGPPGPISGVTAGAGLAGGGTKGNVTLSLLTTCSSGQVLQWNGSTWVCATASGSGTITGVTAGTDLTGGGTNGTVTLNLDTTKVPQLATANNFVGNQAVTGNLNVASGAFQPVAIQSSNSFGTWLALGNSSSGGHTWNIISAGGGNGEGAGNLGITDLTGKSTIWLEGNTNVSGALGVGTLAATNVAILGQGSGGTGAGAGEIGEANPNNGLAGAGIVGWGGGGTNAGAAGLVGYGGNGKMSDGPGAVFHGGNSGPNGSGDGLDAYAGSGFAGFFSGSVEVTGSISKGGGSFKIDHPLDPANKYLYHSFVESPDMKNIYDGVVVTDGNGDAMVPLPEWFETLNRDFRYQLTVVGQFAQAIVASKVAHNQFSIKTDKPNVEVSWQVTGIRQDAWANAHRIPVEEQKNAREQGHYIHPELYGAPEEASIAWARHPEMMKHMKEMRRQQSLPQASAARKSGPAAPKTR